MNIDQDVQTYIENLKTSYYTEGNTQKDGTVILKEMIILVKALISFRKRQVTRKLVFIDKNAVRLNKILETLNAVIENTNLKAKNAIFHSNAQLFMTTSTEMDQQIGRISLEVRNVIRKVRLYERQYDDLLKKKIEYEQVLDYYDTAKEDLETLTGALA